LFIKCVILKNIGDESITESAVIRIAVVQNGTSAVRDARGFLAIGEDEL
jgi:hypothetical protein